MAKRRERFHRGEFHKGELHKGEFHKGEWKNGMIIDIDKLREDLKNDDYGAFFGGGFGGAMMESFEIEDASPERLVEIARDKGIDLGKYRCE